MNKIFMVPVHMDALYLTGSEAASEPTADFRELPYYDHTSRRDVNSDNPWLGESAESPPFENSNMTLQAGVHLHWSLPVGLCRGKVVGGKLVMPAVPNRWLIRRHANSGLIAESWIVESDYLWPETIQAPAVNILHQSSEDNITIPYRFLGRKLTLEEWQNDNEPHEYLKKLTAIGYGEPTFAAYYPNCMSVFGFHDGEPDLPKNSDSLHYDLFGWYGGDGMLPELAWESDPDSQDSMIEPFRRWRIKSNGKPKQLLCYASIKLTTDKPSEASKSEIPEIKVAVGNTVSEALSALLAKEVAEELKDQTLASNIEEQLEAMHIEAQLVSQSQDLGLQLRRYRHQKSFDPVQGSNRFSIHADQPEAGRVPDNILSTLRQLNDSLARFERQQNELAHARRQLYGDWCNYMRCVYRPPDGGRGQFLDVDEVVAYIKNRSLAKVEHLIENVEFTQGQVQQFEKELTDSLVKLNLSAKNTKEDGQPADRTSQARPVEYRLQPIPGARFWCPAEPVVLLTGGNIRLSERHSNDDPNSPDGILQCETYEIESGLEAELRVDDQRNSLFDWLEKQWNPGKCIGFREVNKAGQPWNPLFLDWGIDMYAAEKHSTSAQGSYDKDVITENYKLGKEYPDLQPDILWVNDDPDRFTGRCILGASPSIVLTERIKEFLQRQLQERLILLWDSNNPQDRTYIHTKMDEWAKPESQNTTGRANFKQLVATWANPESNEQKELVYLSELTDWYKGLALNHKTVPLDALPKTGKELEALMAWYAERPKRGEGAKLADDPVYCALLAYRKLFDNVDKNSNVPLRPRAFLGQALSGFNQELIQWKLGLSLPIDEPIGLNPYREFTQNVRRAVDSRETTWSTEPTNNFSPIRSGAFELNKLRLLDSFGRTAKVPCDEKVIVPSPYRVSGRDGVAFLPPRLVQPARVTLRWLDAQAGKQKEMIEAESRSPICGWLLQDKLSGQLQVFDSDGKPLGALIADSDNDTIEWIRAPGLPALNDVEATDGFEQLKRLSGGYYANEFSLVESNVEEHKDLSQLGASIKNQRLARVLLYLWFTRSPDFLQRFLNTLDDALANIDPEGTASMGSKALLMGRPLAVVGAELNLELKDKPAVRQDWSAFILDQNRHQRDTDDFEQVNFQLRLGQFNSRNDGVLGYWREGSEGFINQTFVAQAADDNDPSRPLEGNETNSINARINAHGSGDKVDDLNFTQSVAASPLRTTMLLDPRGQVNLTTGILPVKSIDIPRHLWEPGLEAIRVWFSVAPILSRPGNRRVPTPALAGGQWHWLELVKGKNAESMWQMLHASPSIARDTLQNALKDLGDILKKEDHEAINKLIAKGWLESMTIPDISDLIGKGWLTEQIPPSNRLNLGTREHRKPLDDRTLEAPLDALLAQLSLALVSPGDEPDFNPGVEVREGWLQLESVTGAKQP